MKVLSLDTCDNVFALIFAAVSINLCHKLEPLRLSTVVVKFDPFSFMDFLSVV